MAPPFTAFAQVSVTGPPSALASRTKSLRWRSRTRSRALSRPPTGAATCSRSAAGSWTRGSRTAPRRWTRARWLRSLVREHRDSIPEGAGPAGQPSHIIPPPMCLPRATYFEGTVVPVAPMDQSPHKSRLLAQLAEAHDAWHYMKDDKGERVPTKPDQVSLNWRRHAVQRAVGAFLDWAYAEGDIPSEHLILLVKLVSSLG